MVSDRGKSFLGLHAAYDDARHVHHALSADRGGVDARSPGVDRSGNAVVVPHESDGLL